MAIEVISMKPISGIWKFSERVIQKINFTYQSETDDENEDFFDVNIEVIRFENKVIFLDDDFKPTDDLVVLSPNDIETIISFMGDCITNNTVSYVRYSQREFMKFISNKLNTEYGVDTNDHKFSIIGYKFIENVGFDSSDTQYEVIGINVVYTMGFMPILINDLFVRVSDLP